MKKYTAVILIADGMPDSSGHALDSELVTWPEGGVPVRRGMEDDAPVVGHATLTLDGFSVVAEMELDEVKLGDLEDDQVDALVPAVAGMGNPDAFDLELQFVALGDWTNADDRITPLVPPPPCVPNNNGDCAVCGDIINDEAAPCSGPSMTVEEIDQALIDATGPLVDLDAKILDFPAPVDEEGRPMRKRDPVPEGCEGCPGCPDCLEYADKMGEE